MTETKVKFTVRSDKTEEGKVFRVFRDALLAGSVHVRVTRTGYGYIHSMYVRSDQRRLGAGHAMMKAVLAECGRNMRLELICGGRDGITPEVLGKFYSQHGFVYGPSAWTTRSQRESDARRMFREPS